MVFDHRPVQKKNRKKTTRWPTNVWWKTGATRTLVGPSVDKFLSSYRPGFGALRYSLCVWDRPIFILKELRNLYLACPHKENKSLANKFLCSFSYSLSRTSSTTARELKRKRIRNLYAWPVQSFGSRHNSLCDCGRPNDWRFAHWHACVDR